MRASEKGHLDVVKTLIEAGADVHQTDQVGIVAHAQSQTDYKLDDSLEHTYAYNTRDYILFCLLFINAHGTSALECSAVRLSPAVAIVTQLPIQ